MEQVLFSSVETLPHARASVAFTELKPVFKEDDEITPTILSDTHSYMPWGATNQMPFDIIDLIESDETLATCQMFNAEVCYGSGLVYACAKASAPIKYHIEVSQKYWDSIFKSEGITDRSKQQARIVEEKQRILDFLTGVENSGKVWFSTFTSTPTATRCTMS